MNIENELLEKIRESNQLGNIETIALPRRYNGHGRNPALVELNPPRPGTSRKIREATNRVFKILGAYTESYMEDFYKSDLKMTHAFDRDTFGGVVSSYYNSLRGNGELSDKITTWGLGERLNGTIDNRVMPIFGLDTILYSLSEERPPRGRETNRFRYIEKLALLKSKNVKVKQIEPDTYRLTVDYTLIEAEIEDEDFIMKVGREMEKAFHLLQSPGRRQYGENTHRFPYDSPEYLRDVVQENEGFREELDDLMRLGNKKTMRNTIERLGVETESFKCCMILNKDFAEDWIRVMRYPLEYDNRLDILGSVNSYRNDLNMTDLGSRGLFAAAYGGSQTHVDDHDIEHLFTSERINCNPEFTPSPMGKIIWFYNSDVGYIESKNTFYGRLNINTGFGEGGMDYADEFFIGLTPPEQNYGDEIEDIILNREQYRGCLNPSAYKMMQVIMKADSPHVGKLQSRTLSMYRRDPVKQRENPLGLIAEDEVEGEAWKHFMYALNPLTHREGGTLGGDIVSMSDNTETHEWNLSDLRHLAMYCLGFYRIGPCKSHMADQKKLGELFEVSERYNGIFEFEIDRPLTLRYRFSIWEDGPEVVSRDMKRGRYRVVLKEGPDLERSGNGDELDIYLMLIDVMSDVELIYESDRITLIEDVDIEGLTPNMDNFKRDLELMDDIDDIEDVKFERDNRLNEL